MHTPQVILIVVLAIELGLVWARHGQPRTDKYNVFINLLGTSVFVGLLIWGGFFG